MESKNTNFQCVLKMERVERMERVFFKSNYREVIFLAEDKIQILEGGCQNTLSRLSRLSGRFSISKEVRIDPKSMTDDIKNGVLS